jgi:hypothetical protein
VSDDWLAVDEPSTVPAWHFTRHPRKAKPVSTPVKNHNGTAEGMRRQYLQLKKALGLQHRHYLDALMQTNFHLTNAQQIMYGLGYRLDKSTYTRWRQRKDMAAAIETAKRYSEAVLGLSGDGVLVRVKELHDYGMDRIKLRGRNGELLTDEKGDALEALRDPELALKAAELLGKNKKLWGTDEEQARVTVQIVNLAGDQQATPIMDGEFTQGAEDDN